jgi:hypothetical protein
MPLLLITELVKMILGRRMRSDEFPPKTHKSQSPDLSLDHDVVPPSPHSETNGLFEEAM